MRVSTFWLPCISVCWCACAFADPVAIRNLNPLLSGYEVPPALPGAPPDNIALTAEFAIGNITLDKHNAYESVQLDGELQRWQMSFSKPISDTLNMRLELPFIRISGGHLDNFIESFHDIFGMPNGNRDVVPTNRLLIQHRRDGVTDFSMTTARSGVGDVTLRLGKHLDSDQDAASIFSNTLWVSIKLPTGSADKLTGSGAVDMAFSLAASQRFSSRFVTHQQVSMSILGKGERLTGQQQSKVWSGSIGIDGDVTQHWGAVLQLDGNTKVFSSELRILGPTLQLSVGPRYQSAHWRGELIIVEDIATDTAPDVQFQLAVTRKY
jgi:Protein of unknown function (DUF3187)